MMTTIKIINGGGYETLDIDVTKLTKDMLTVQMSDSVQELRRRKFFEAFQSNDVVTMVKWAWIELHKDIPMPIFAHMYTI